MGSRDMGGLKRTIASRSRRLGFFQFAIIETVVEVGSTRHRGREGFGEWGSVVVAVDS